jgi:cytochrome c556
MPRFSLLATITLMTAIATGASAQAPMMHNMPGMTGHMPPAMSPADTRELLHFPPEMEIIFLQNMRDHVETLNAVLQAVAEGDYAEASKVAKERLGLDSPAAAGCKPAATGKDAMSKMPAPNSMDAMMAMYMPEAMRNIGLAMHTSASEFAEVAAKAATTHDTASVIKALSNIMPNCVACHSTYRIR